MIAVNVMWSYVNDRAVGKVTVWYICFQLLVV